MNLTVIKEPGAYTFTGNAVMFEVLSDSNDAIIVDISCNGDTQTASFYPFANNGIFTAKFDIAGYLNPSSGTGDYPQGEIISSLPDFAIPYQVKIGEDYIFEGTAFKGGISHNMQSVLEKEGFDLFTYRLDSHFDQFLFTTRTNGKTVRVRESELYPFVFIHPGIDISFHSASGNRLTAPAQPEGTVCVMDIAEVRKRFTETYKETPDDISVMVAGECAFTVKITPGHISEEKYLVKFRNSLGAYELIEIVGTANHEPDISEPDNYQSLTEYGFFTDKRERLSFRDVIKVETGYKTKDEILFIRDMVCSEDTYFIYPDGSYFRCHVSVDAMKYRHKQVAPTSVPLIITDVNDNRYISPFLDWSTLVSRAGIFDETFDDTFE